jgi:hypothetical protein
VIELYRALCGLRGEDGEGAAVTEQGAVQQALRRGGGGLPVKARRRDEWHDSLAWPAVRCEPSSALSESLVGGAKGSGL